MRPGPLVRTMITNTNHTAPKSVKKLKEVGINACRQFSLAHNCQKSRRDSCNELGTAGKTLPAQTLSAPGRIRTAIPRAAKPGTIPLAGALKANSLGENRLEQDVRLQDRAPRSSDPAINCPSFRASVASTAAPTINDGEQPSKAAPFLRRPSKNAFHHMVKEVV